MTLAQTQMEFARLLPRLIDKAYELGYTVTLGECYRSPEEAKRLAKLGLGIVNTLHCIKLAIDLNLFRDDKYLSDNESHRLLGTWWEMQSAGKDFTCNWGGHFGDGNHYSIGWGGRR